MDGFYKYINSRRKTRENLLLYGAGASVSEDMEKDGAGEKVELEVEQRGAESTSCHMRSFLPIQAQMQLRGKMNCPLQKA